MTPGFERAAPADVGEPPASVALGKAPPDGGDAKAHEIAPEGAPATSALASALRNGPLEDDGGSQSPCTARPPEAPPPSAHDGDTAASPTTDPDAPGSNSSSDLQSGPQSPGDGANAAAVVRSPPRPPHATPRSLRLRLHTTAHSPHQKPSHQASPPTSPTVPDAAACNCRPPDGGGTASHPPEVIANHPNEQDCGDLNGECGDLGTLDLNLDLDLDTLSFLDAMESFAEGITAGGGGGGGGGLAAGPWDGPAGGRVDGFLLPGAGRDGGGEDGDDEGNAAMMDCLEVPAGGPTAVMAEALADMHEVFSELPHQLHELQEERREAQGTPLKRRKFVARLLGMRLFRRSMGPSGLLLRDKLTFLLGTTMMWVCAFWLGRSPATFYQLYCGVGAVLMACRWALYFKRKWHYYLYDFCYYANLLLVAQVILGPRWAALAKVTFAYTTGPLAWSILTFRNSLVFHDLDKVTSLFLHLVPALVSLTLRWHQPEGGRFGPPPEATPEQRRAWGSAGLVSNVLIPMAAYVAWAVAYYLKIFVFSRTKIQQRGYRTLFNYVTSQKKGAFHAIARRIPLPLQPPVYLSLHLAFCCCTFLLALACWHSYATHAALLAAVASASIWHGGSYYFEVFARRYDPLGPLTTPKRSAAADRQPAATASATTTPRPVAKEFKEQ